MHYLSILERRRQDSFTGIVRNWGWKGTAQSISTHGEWPNTLKFFSPLTISKKVKPVHFVRSTSHSYGFDKQPISDSPRKILNPMDWGLGACRNVQCRSCPQIQVCSTKLANRLPAFNLRWIITLLKVS